jgi:hypothetical protein
MVQHVFFLQPSFCWWKVKSILYLIFFDLFVLFMSMHFKTALSSFFRNDYPVPTSRSPGKGVAFHWYFHQCFYGAFPVSVSNWKKEDEENSVMTFLLAWDIVLRNDEKWRRSQNTLLSLHFDYVVWIFNLRVFKNLSFCFYLSFIRFLSTSML